MRGGGAGGQMAHTSRCHVPCRPGSATERQAQERRGRLQEHRPRGQPPRTGLGFPPFGHPRQEAGGRDTRSRPPGVAWDSGPVLCQVNSWVRAESAPEPESPEATAPGQAASLSDRSGGLCRDGKEGQSSPRPPGHRMQTRMAPSGQGAGELAQQQTCGGRERGLRRQNQGPRSRRGRGGQPGRAQLGHPQAQEKPPPSLELKKTPRNSTQRTARPPPGPATLF